ncbi:DUF1206 domain-containing protein [Pontibacter sp. BT310]|uniref:DUF1206 domain-containing protein n=1 Tax=Pontibacter populi TaxID=890055 RepID=A0ABS6XFF8_9BACT|nr:MULTISPECIES: DUF1206 domain-containing protein [Pontibacter]MBJ6119773.1 DUF1206 domain-containing protein [Pontibacter sp. BT310]MBR0572202.1 DUF1206 domain-containing protein [Microvirga sp. STS03]MBW3366626.1 DUF1206 domain-containing protein [Pontibacter populi]
MIDIAQHVPTPPPAWVKNMARFGLTAKGVVYCLVGILAFMAAFEIGGKSEQGSDKSGVFQFILEQSYGWILLAIIALGLLCYTIWRIIQAFKDTENKGDNAKGIGVRIRYAFSGVVYGALAFYAAQLVLGNGGGSNGDSRQSLARELLQQPFGQWLVGIVAVGTAIAGFHQIYLAISDKYKKKVQGSGLKHEAEAMMIRAGKIGYIARGIVWLIIAYLFLKAAMNANPNEAGGSGSAFQFLENSSYGSYLLGAVAIGLIFYGVFMFMRARYQVINVS